MANTFDKIDLKILKILQEEGRITNLQLSNNVGLSPAPTLERVKKLEKNGVIKSYHAVLDQEKLGMSIQSFMLVTLARHKSNAIAQFSEQINNIDEVVECYHITGVADYLLKIIVPDIASYEKLLRERISAVEEISHMQTMMILSTVKNSRQLPLEYE